MSEAHLSEEELNAFVDDQLNPADRSRVLEAINHDAALQRRVADYQQIQNLVRHAYQRPPEPARVAARTPVTARVMLAAGLLLGLGLGGGWLLHGWKVNSGLPTGVVIQVSENDPAKWEMALVNARNVRKAYGDKNMGIEIVAYGPGLAMFRSDSSATSGMEDAAQHGVKLLACGNTMSMTHTTLQELNPRVGVVAAGVVEIMQKQKEGYAYVRP
jgi:intracellular sulfur oxidation DsrE/DsrF family protein